jgi:hypothetical protein
MQTLPESLGRILAVMIDLLYAADWLEGSIDEWLSLLASPETLLWLVSTAMLLAVFVFWPVLRWRRRVAAMEWRRTLAARARA